MTIDQNPANGTPLYLRDNQWSSKLFGGTRVDNQPKRKFTFLCGFIPNPNVTSMETTREIYDQMTFMVKSFDPPRFNIDTEVLDQYNKKRIVQKRINYEPVTIRFHDDIGNKVFKMMYEYIRYYYKDTENTDLQEWSPDVVKNFINEGQWGFTLNFKKYFFASMYVAWINGGTLNYMNLRNPIISDIQLDTLDYADGNAPLEIIMNVEYEGVVFREINAPIGESSINDVEHFIRSKLVEMDHIGQPGKGPDPHNPVPGGSRIPGLGEIFSDVSTFFGKHNGKPTARDALDDFVLRPIKGQASSVLNSWGNFNFGGIGTAKSQSGLLGGVGNAVGTGYKYVKSGGIVQDVFKQGGGVSAPATKNTGKAVPTPQQANDFYKNTTGNGGEA